MYELKTKNGKVFASKSVGTGPSSYEKRIYRTAVSQFEKHCIRWRLCVMMEAVPAAERLRYLSTLPEFEPRTDLALQ